MIRNSFFLLAVLLVGAAAFATRPGVAQEYPKAQIRIVVPSAAGTPPDTLTRIVANELMRAEGWRVIIENKPGAMQTLGATEVLRQSADGYTVLAVAMSSTVAPYLMANIGFRLAEDFSPVVRLATVDHVLVVHPSVPAKTLNELVQHMKQNPAAMSYSSGGFGTPAHVAGELFKLTAGVQAAHVPYQALPQAIGDLLNGTVQFQFITPLPVLGLISTGKLRALAVTAPARMPKLPDIPAVGEEGFPGLVIQDWIGLLVKRGAPDEAIVRLNKAVNAALSQPDVRKLFTSIAADPAAGSPQEFEGFIASQLEHWGKLVKTTGMKIH